MTLAASGEAHTIALAIADRENGRYAEGAARLTGYLASNPDDARALAHLAHTQLLCRQDAAAHTALALAETLAPDLPLVLKNRARLALKSQKIDDAAAAITRALVIDPADRETRLIRAAVLAAKGDTASAMQIVDALLAEDPDYAEALIQRALLHMRGQNPAAATADARRAADIKPHLSQAWRLLAALHTQGQRGEDALSALQRYCDLEPEDVTALTALGEMLRQRGLTGEALVVLARAVELKPDFVAAWINYGAALQQVKRIDEAKIAYTKALDIDPNLAEVANNLGAIFSAEENWSEAVAQFDRALALKPDNAEARMNLGVALKNEGRLDEAISSYEQALRLKPNYAEAFNNQGNALWQVRRLDEALASYGRAVAFKPNFAEAYNNRGIVLKDLKRLDEALASFGWAIDLKPDYADAFNNRGIVLWELKRFDEALASFNCAIDLKPDYADALNNRGIILQELRRDAEALASFDQALETKLDYANALNSRGNLLGRLNRYEEAIRDFERLLILNCDFEYARGLLLHSKMQCCDWRSLAEELMRLMREIRAKKRVSPPFALLGLSENARDQLLCSQVWVQDRCPKISPPLWNGDRYRHDRIRVAYLSADFRDHAMSYLMVGVLELHDRARYEVLGVSFGPDHPGEMQSRVKGAFDRFIEVGAKTDREVAKLLRDREVDIAVDLMGHTKHSRPKIFAMRPAPIQIIYLGYAGTTGADYMDYIVADRFVIPPEHHTYYTEKVVYLPDTYLASDSSRRIGELALTRSDVGLPEKGCVFCCFNNNYKITPTMFDLWMRILQKIEGSVLWLREGNASAPIYLRHEAEMRGVSPDRLVFAARMKNEDHLARHRLADIFLDTQYVNAHTTASDALWVGLPIITCPGATFASRVAGSLLTAIGLPELIARSIEEYETLALKLARDPGLLTNIKQKLAHHRDSYPLFRTERFTRHIEAAYSTTWERYQRGEAPASFAVEP